MRKFYVYFPNSETLSHVLSWSHYFEILKSDDPLEISFYTKECEAQKWSIRDPFVLEFTGLPELPTWNEKTLEDALASNLSMFMLCL